MNMWDSIKENPAHYNFGNRNHKMVSCIKFNAEITHSVCLYILEKGLPESVIFNCRTELNFSST